MKNERRRTGMAKMEHFWTGYETAYLVENWKTQTATVIAAHLGLSRGAVTGKAQKLRLSKPRPTFWNEERIAYLKKWWLASDAKEIGAHLGCSKSAVIGKAHRLDLIDKQEYCRSNGLKQSPGKRRPRAVVNGTNRTPAPPKYLGLGDDPPTCEPVGFMALARDQCHAPLDFRGPDGLIMYCGDGVCKRLVKDGKDWSYTDAPYCAYHYRRFNKVGKNANK
jgi:hypothetical protein